MELPKFEELLKQEGRSLQELTLEEKWYYFLIHAPLTTDEELSVLSASLEIKAAYEALNYHGLSACEQRSYDLAEKSRLDEIAILDKLQEEATQKGRELGKEEGLKEGLELGKQKGRKEGRKEGLELGKQKGRKEGRKEGMEIDKQKGRELRNIEIAKSMLAKNLSVDTISAVTGLSLEQVKALQ